MRSVEVGSWRGSAGVGMGTPQFYSCPSNYSPCMRPHHLTLGCLSFFASNSAHCALHTESLCSTVIPGCEIGWNFGERRGNGRRVTPAVPRAGPGRRHHSFPSCQPCGVGSSPPLRARSDTSSDAFSAGRPRTPALRPNGHNRGRAGRREPSGGVVPAARPSWSAKS